MNTKHWVWPSEAIVAAVIVAVIMFLASVSFSSCQQGRVKTASTTIAKKVASTTTTTTVEPITDWLDLHTLNENIIIYRDSYAEVDRLNKELDPILAKERDDRSDKEATDAALLKSLLQSERSNLNTAVDSYNPVARKYTKAELNAHEFSAELKKVK